MAFPKALPLNLTVSDRLRILAGWGSVAAFSQIHVQHLPFFPALLLFLYLFAVILWCAFGVVREADLLADRLGEPYGTLILTLSIVSIEVILISVSMLENDAAGTVTTIGRDAMVSVMMIIMNGIFGSCLIIGSFRSQPSYNQRGAYIYLACIALAATAILIVPSFLPYPGDGTLSRHQILFFAPLTAISYGMFLWLQTGRCRHCFIDPARRRSRHKQESHQGYVLKSALLIIVYMLPVTLLAKPLAVFINHGIGSLGIPAAIGGLTIALIVFTPEAITACKAATNNEMQRVMNLCHGAFISTVGLTAPAILAIALITDHRVVLGTSTLEASIILATLVLTVLSFSFRQARRAMGILHLFLFLVYMAAAFSQ